MSNPSSRVVSPKHYNLQFIHAKSIQKELKLRLRTPGYHQYIRMKFQHNTPDNIKKQSTSCHCCCCGKMSDFQIKVWRQTRQFETAFHRRKRVFRRFRIAGYAAQFLVFYKAEQLLKHKKQKQYQQFLKNPLIAIRRQTIMTQSAHSHRSPLSLTPSDKLLRRNATDYLEFDQIKEKSQFEDPISTAINNRNSTIKKRQISIYMEKMLKNITIKQNALHLTPLSLVNRRLQKNKSFQCVTQQISPKNSIATVDLARLLTHSMKNSRPKLSKTNTFHSEYSINNKEVTKLIDVMKIKHRQLKKPN